MEQLPAISQLHGIKSMINQTSDELREEMRKKRKEDGRQRSIEPIITDNGNTGGTTQGRARSSGSTSEPADTDKNRSGNDSSGPLQQLVSAVSGRTDDNSRHDSTATDIEGKLARSTGSAPQNNRRSRQSPRRSSEDHTEDRSNGTDLRESTSGSELTVKEETPPSIFGNLQRNTDEEASTYIPPRNFAPEQAPIVGQPALIYKDGKFQQREPDRPKSKQKDGARAVETVKALIPKAKRGRPSSKSNPQNILNGNITFDEQQKGTLKDKLKQAGQAIPKGNKLTTKEIEELREPLQVALTDEFSMLDQLLWKYEGSDSLEQPIWSDIQDNEMEKFVNAILNMGTRSSTVATIARASVDMSDYIIAGTLLAPRLQTTAGLVKQVRQKKQSMKTGTTRGRRFSH